MSTSPYTNIYPTGTFKEIDLRKELDRFLNGAPDEIAKGKVGMLRIMRLDDNGEPTRCPCRNQVTDEPDKDYYCRFCLGSGYFWDERQVVYYKNTDSFSDNSGYFYVKYDKLITDKDYLVELKLDAEGDIEQPAERNKFFKIEKAEQFRSDRGRIEYWRILAKEERKWSVWYGVTHRQHN